MIIILIIIFIMFFINHYYHYFKKEFFENNEKKWIILLTTCVSPTLNTNIKSNNEMEERKNLYIKQINRWLNETPYYIYVVESSGYDFPEIKHDRLKVFTFIPSNKYSSSSQYEAASIIYAIENLEEEEEYKKSNFILKVTGRYFLENIENVLKNINKEKDIYIQIHRNDSDNWQNSEYYGMSKKDLQEFIQTVKDNGIMEKKLYEYTKNKNYQQIGPFKNNVKRGGDGLVLEDL